MRWQTVCTSGQNLDWLIYNDPLANAELILDGDIANYLKSVSYVNDRS
ncbi:MAG: DUF6061 family protein [Gemmiger sp.]